MKILEQTVAKLLIKQKKTIAVAESCTGGLISNRLTNIPGSSKYFKVGIVAYSNNIKIQQLKVPPCLIKQKGAVSKEVAIYMAKNIRRIAKTDFGLGITGIAGPKGATKTKKVGLVFIALSTGTNQVYKKFNFKGGRISVKRKTSSAALRLLMHYLKNNE